MVRTLCFHCRGLASIPAQGTKIPQLCHTTKKKKKEKLKKKPKNGRKIFPIHTSDTRLVPRMYKVLSKLNNGKINNQVIKWAKDLNRYLHQRIFTDRKETYEKMFNIIRY